MKQRTLLIGLVISGLLTVSCGLTNNFLSKTEPEPASAPINVEPVIHDDTPETVQLPLPEADVQLVLPAPPVDEAHKSTDLQGLHSYRTVTLTRNGSQKGPIREKIVAAWIIDPTATLLKIEGSGVNTPLELVAIDETVWMRSTDTHWNRMTLGEAAPYSWQDILTTIQDFPPERSWSRDWPEDVVILPGQTLFEIKGGMTLKDLEWVNGVLGQRYGVDNDFAYSEPLPPPLQGNNHYRGHIQGEVWLAAQDDLPVFLVCARLEKTLTIRSPHGEVSETIYYEYDVIDINAPLNIEPPS